MPTKSCQSGGLLSPLASAMAITAAISITHDNGLFINIRNFNTLFSCKHNDGRMTLLSYLLSKYTYIADQVIFLEHII